MSRLIIKSPHIKSGAKAGGFMKYIATRDGVETMMSYIANRPGSHGLFCDTDSVDLAKAMGELSQHDGIVWTHILSLRREDAARLGYDNAQSWRNLLKTHRNDIANAMKIPPNCFRWYAAFHNEGDHPHVHMIAWSSDPKQGFLTKTGIENMKSTLINDIFKHEMLHLYEQKSMSRDELVRSARREIKRLSRRLSSTVIDVPDIENLMQNLSQRLETVRGKKQYGYLPKDVKRLVNEIVDQLERQPIVEDCYEKWWRLNERVRGYYTGEVREKLPLSQAKEFRSILNAVIGEAERLRLDEVSFEREPSNSSVMRLLYHLSRLFASSAPAQSKQDMRIDSKRRRKLLEKKQALGHHIENELTY